MDLNESFSMNNLSAMRKFEEDVPQIFEKYNLCWALGKGSFGTAFLASSLDGKDSKMYAIKYIRPGSDTADMQAELNNLQRVKGLKNVVQYVDHVPCTNCTAIITNYSRSDSFKHSYRYFSPKDVQFYMKNLLISLEQLHSRGLIHSDVKPANFLFDNDNHKYLLIDLGLAFPVGTALEDAGTVGYIPFESVLNWRESKAVHDIWSAGAIFITLLSGIYPFFFADGLESAKELSVIFGTDEVKRVALKLNALDIVERTLETFEYRHPLSLRKICLFCRYLEAEEQLPQTIQCPQCERYEPFCLCPKDTDDTDPDVINSFNADPFPESAYDLLEKMLKVDPDERITAEDALQHRFFKHPSLGTTAFISRVKNRIRCGFVKSLSPKFYTSIRSKTG